MKQHTFLIAIGTDELPPRILKKLGKDLFNYIVYEFKRNNIFVSTATWFAAPRHLAVKSEILISEKDLLFIKSHSVDSYSSENELCTYRTNKSDLYINNRHYSNKRLRYESFNKYTIHKKDKNQKNFRELLLIVVQRALDKLVNYKMMRWGSVHESFIRPVNTVTILLDSYLILGRFFEINVDRVLFGHRYISKNKIILSHANDYPEILMTQGRIIVDYNVRKNTLRAQIEKQALDLGGIADTRDEEFLEEITSSIEWPIVLFGKFDERFLHLPLEVVTYIMKKNQKYFPVYSITNGVLLPCFIFVINTITNDYSKIIIGHENIIKTRFKDAEFFLKNDSQYRLEEYVPKLDFILFHRNLGSVRDKVNRIMELSEWIANQVNVDTLPIKRAGYLCKCDLVSDMVREFPDLQGIIGMYYARRDGESEQVALAQKEHYQPQSITDIIPTEQVSCILSIADKMDTISGIFSIEKFPTNNRDPFALKRSAIGILNIIIQRKMSINLMNLIHKSVGLYESNLTKATYISKNIYKFMYNRLYLFYVAKGYRIDVIKSVLNSNLTNTLICEDQIRIVDDFCKFRKKEFHQLSLLDKRVTNILKKQNIPLNNKSVSSSLFKSPEEIQFYSKLIKIDQKIQCLFEQKCYKSVLDEVIYLSDFAHDFLDKIIILDQDQDVRINRLILLNTLKKLIQKVINISELQH